MPRAAGSWRCCNGRESATARGPSTCAGAARGGHLEMMQWAREHGALWDVVYVRLLAAEGGHQEKLERWLAEHGGA